MGNTTIIELNHDRANEIIDDPEAFLASIVSQLQHADIHGDALPGGTVIAYFSRHGGATDKAWEKWKREFGGYGVR